MTRRFWTVLLGGALIGLPAFLAWSVRTTPRPPQAGAAPLPALPSARPDDPAAPAPAPAVSVQDALLRRVDLPFDEPTSLIDVQKYLAENFGLAVVLDRAALARLNVDPEDTVQLNIRGVRLKTGLKLLLDQVEMAYRVEAEDNLLILTDARESHDPSIRALVEIKALHQEIHDLQDAVDDLRDLVEDDLGIEPSATDEASVFVKARAARPTTDQAGRRRTAPRPR